MLWAGGGGVEFGIEMTRRDVLELDSSTDRKFSRHLIVHVPGAVFLNNFHGSFSLDLDRSRSDSRG